jgi:hypothetical protein
MYAEMSQWHEHHSGGHQLKPTEQPFDFQARAHRQRGGGLPVEFGEWPDLVGVAHVAGV